MLLGAMLLGPSTGTADACRAVRWDAADAAPYGPTCDPRVMHRAPSLDTGASVYFTPASALLRLHGVARAAPRAPAGGARTANRRPSGRSTANRRARALAVSVHTWTPVLTIFDAADAHETHGAETHGAGYGGNGQHKAGG